MEASGAVVVAALAPASSVVAGASAGASDASGALDSRPSMESSTTVSVGVGSAAAGELSIGMEMFDWSDIVRVGGRERARWWVRVRGGGCLWWVHTKKRRLRLHY